MKGRVLMTDCSLETQHGDRRADDASHGQLFTKAQRRVLRLLCQGLTNAEIATRIGLKESTIKGTVSGILKRVRVHSRTQAVVHVCQYGMVSPEWCAGTEFGALDVQSVQEASEVSESEVRGVNALTDREMMVLEMVSRGLPNKEVAFLLGVREGTVKAHMGSILRKLGVSSRTKLAIEVSKLQTAATRSRPKAAMDERKSA